MAFVQHAGPAAHALIAPAVSSFIHGMHEAAVCSVVISGVAVAAARNLDADPCRRGRGPR